MLSYDKEEVKNELTTENIFELLQSWGGDPEYTNFGIISDTICHNPPGVGSHKLYYYSNSKFFNCYTQCENSVFDIFDLVIKIMEIQQGVKYNLNDAVIMIATRFGITTENNQRFELQLKDWNILDSYSRVQELEIKDYANIVLKEYDNTILNNFNYNIKILPWLKEHISQEVMDKANITYYPGGNQIVIPHYDKNNRLVGLRGRSLSIDDIEKYGKYRPLYINKQLYNHPLGMNLYGLNWNKDHIKTIKKAIIVEGEKSVLLYASYFGWDNNICVACCGSSISAYQVQFLLDLGVEEIVIAFDKQFKDINTIESRLWEKKLLKIHEKYSKDCLISFIWDKNNLLNYKDAPLDQGSITFLRLFKERIVL